MCLCRPSRKIPQPPRSQGFPGHWNIAFLKQHGLSHYCRASSADGESRAEKGVQSHPRITARDCKASQDWAVPECTVLELPARILSWAQVFLGYILGTGFIFGTLKIYQTNKMLQTTLQVKRISTAAVPANTARALDKGSGCCSSVKYIVFLKPR